MIVPYAHIDTVFLDVGNTLISIDFDWVAAELTARGLACTPEEVRRAEAAARPSYANRLFSDGLPEGFNAFGFYLHAMIARLDAVASEAAVSDPPRDIMALVNELRPVLRPDGKASSLWRLVMPRVREALARLRTLNTTLVVVSNSDGTVEHSLEEAGLRQYFSVVIDSAIVGYEKPDPRIFERALDACGSRPERTLHVGDIYQADVIGARSAGIHAVLLDPYGDWPDAQVADVDRVPDVFAVADQLEAARERAAAGR